MANTTPPLYLSLDLPPHFRGPLQELADAENRSLKAQAEWILMQAARAHEAEKETAKPAPAVKAGGK